MADKCRPVDVDGAVVIVRGSRPLTVEEQGFMAEIVRAAREKFAADRLIAGQVPDNPNRTTPPALAEVTAEAKVPTWRCVACGSKRWVQVSLNGDFTLSAQCVPCGRVQPRPPATQPKEQTNA